MILKWIHMVESGMKNDYEETKPTLELTKKKKKTDARVVTKKEKHLRWCC